MFHFLQQGLQQFCLLCQRGLLSCGCINFTLDQYKRKCEIAWKPSELKHVPMSVMSLFLSWLSSRAIIISTAFRISLTLSSFAPRTASTFFSWKTQRYSSQNFQNVYHMAKSLWTLDTQTRSHINTWAPNQHIRMISERSRDTENWSNDA